MSEEYLEALRLHQKSFLDGITEDPAETIRRQACYDAWVASTFKPNRGNLAASHSEHERLS